MAVKKVWPLLPVSHHEIGVTSVAGTPMNESIVPEKEEWPVSRGEGGMASVTVDPSEGAVVFVAITLIEEGWPLSITIKKV